MEMIMRSLADGYATFRNDNYDFGLSVRVQKWESHDRPTKLFVTIEGFDDTPEKVWGRES